MSKMIGPNCSAIVCVLSRTVFQVRYRRVAGEVCAAPAFKIKTSGRLYVEVKKAPDGAWQVVTFSGQPTVERFAFTPNFGKAHAWSSQTGGA